MTRAGVLTPERELMLLLAGTAERREARRARANEVARAVDFDSFGRALVAQKLFPLLGARIAELDFDPPADFTAALTTDRNAAGLRADVIDRVTSKLIADLALGGIVAVALKGPSLARRLHGDVGLRPTSDIDLLVLPEAFDGAVECLQGVGYHAPSSARYPNGLPLFEAGLPPEKDWLPPIDLHWRVSWYETEFSRALVQRSEPGDGGGRVVAVLDELAMLLTIYARDGLAGLRTAADIAAWWDRYGIDLGESLLDPVMEAHPELRLPLAASIEVVDRLVGVPADRLVSDRWRLGSPARLATRLSNWSLEGSESDRLAAVTLVDGLLTSPGMRSDFVNRHLLPPEAVVAKTYGIESSNRLRRRLGRLRYGALVTAGLVAPSTRVLWRVRGGRTLASLG